MKHDDAIHIIGGGIIGLTCAYELAKAGCRVQVFDKGEMGREASWAGAGILPPGRRGMATNPFDQLRAESVARFADYSAELRQLTGVDNGYWNCGGIELLADVEPERMMLWEREGIEYESINAVTYFLPGYAQVRNPWHLRALTAACQALGVGLHPHTPMHPHQLEPNRKYVLCAGAWSGDWAQNLGWTLNVKPMLGQILLYRTRPGLLTRIVIEDKQYIVPRQDGRVLVGSTEEPEAGFQKRTTAAGLAGLKEFAERVQPELFGQKIEATWAGLRPASLDGLPTIGPLPNYPNIIVATGHFRAGVQQSIGTALLVNHWLLGKACPIESEPFRPERSTIDYGQPTFRS
jgi:glycine oxidase